MSVIRVQYRRGVSLDAIAAEHGLPPGSVRLVARPSRWGNPYTIAEYGRAEAVRRFEDTEVFGRHSLELAEWLEPLCGAAALACYCPVIRACPECGAELPADGLAWCRACNRPVDQVPCHADVLIRLLEETAA